MVNAIKMILQILDENPIGKQHTCKLYDALNYDLSLVDKYGGYLPDELQGPPSTALLSSLDVSLNGAPSSVVQSVLPAPLLAAAASSSYGQNLQQFVYNSRHRPQTSEYITTELL